MKIPSNLLYTGNLYPAHYGYPCFDCHPKNYMDEFKFVIGFSYNPPRGSIRESFTDTHFAIVYRCPMCGRIFWLHCGKDIIVEYMKYKKKKGKEE